MSYRLMVAPRIFDVFWNKYLQATFKGKYASSENIKFPRGNYHTDSSEI